MESDSQYSENQPLKPHNEVIVQGERLSEHEYLNLPVYNSHFPTPLQPYPPFSNPQLEKRQPHLFLPALQSQDPQALQNTNFQPVYQLSGLPTGPLKEGQAYALYIKDGAAVFQPYQASTGGDACDWLSNFDKMMRKNTFSYYRIFLYINIIIALLNFIPSLVFAITNAQKSLWFVFTLGIVITLNGLFEVFSIYNKKLRATSGQIGIFMIYLTFYLIVLVILGLDMQRERGRYIHVDIPVLIIFRIVKIVYLVMHMISYVGHICMILLDQKYTQEALSNMKLTKT